MLIGVGAESALLAEPRVRARHKKTCRGLRSIRDKGLTPFVRFLFLILLEA
jgi:hypothetical protein